MDQQMKTGGCRFLRALQSDDYHYFTSFDTKLDENRDILERTLPGVRQRRDALEEELRNLNKQLESNPEYAEIRSLQRELEMLTEKNARLQAEAESFEKETNYEPIKAEVKRLRALYNEHLVAAASGRK
ncbi:unnamed protein product [Haemonchus placei]|uniref:RH2 domain-containing protein n=1 Tax=Haemonchus placei TaxID=6290 RepID=A0A0N4VZ15_HAEPC|nr:unnamed protein product [Haemonchus placei]